MAEAAVEPIGWKRSLMAAAKVKERLRRATRALDAAGLPYAVAGGNAVAEWVARVDEDAVRKTRDVASRDKDRTHLRDMIGVGFLDAAWPARFPAPLGDRLQRLLDDPNG